MKWKTKDIKHEKTFFVLRDGKTWGSEARMAETMEIGKATHTGEGQQGAAGASSSDHGLMLSSLCRPVSQGKLLPDTSISPTCCRLWVSASSMTISYLVRMPPCPPPSFGVTRQQGSRVLLSSLFSLALLLALSISISKDGATKLSCHEERCFYRQLGALL